MHLEFVLIFEIFVNISVSYDRLVLNHKPPLQFRSCQWFFFRTLHHGYSDSKIVE